jgi:AMP-activated protein kinase-like protein
MADHETDNFIEGIAAELRRPVRIDASFDAKVMAALEPSIVPLHAPRRRGRFSWLLQPRSVSVSPLGALAVAAGIAAVALIGMRRGADVAPQITNAAAPVLQPVANVTSNGVRIVSQSFVFVAPAARSVSIVGDFNDWSVEATPLALTSDGVWSVTVPLPLGRHEYQFVVDGKEWKQDPAAPQAPENDFGTRNSLVTVRGGGE